MENKLDVRRIGIFLAFAFGIAWLTGLAIYLTGGLANSPKIGSILSLAAILLAGPYMFAPALANLLTRLVTREGWKDMKLRPNFRKGWPYWLAGWLLPPLLTVVGGAVFYLIFPQYFDSTLPYVRDILAKTGQTFPFSIQTLVLVQAAASIIQAPIFNSLFTFGEEFGWRGYLLPKLMVLGPRKALLAIGVIWGVWHWPVIFMGYEYGFNYPGFPWLGPLLFIWITFGFGTILGWLSIRAKSIWPAVIGHAAINGTAALAILAVTGNPNTTLGPSPVGVIGSIGFAVLTLVIFLSPKALAE
jgi:uncharacterized protein